MTADALTPGLHWSIKRAFVLYVARIADGQILGSRDLRMTDPSTFLWALGSSEADPDGGARVAFSGAVVFSAHAGALSFRVSEPHVELSPGRSSMSVAGEGDSRVPFVDFSATRASDDEDGKSVWHGTDVRLREEALALFAGYYGAGESFDDLRIVLPSP